MKNIGKKIISIMLTASMALGCISLSASAASSFFSVNNDTSMLEDLGIFTDGRLEDLVTRAEFTKVTVMISPYRDYVATSLKTSPYSDVPYDHWASNYIKTAVTNGLCSGYPDGTFRPDDYVSFAEAVTMLLRALGYTDTEFGTSWPYGQIGLASNLGISDGVNRDAFDAITREDVVIMLNQTLDTQMKDSTQKLLDDFDITTTDDVILTATSNEDPAVNSNKINTTAGTYNIEDDFDKSLAGRKGNIAVKDGDTLVSFRASNQTVEEYTVTAVIGGDLMLDGTIVDIEDTTPVYYRSQETTYSAILSTAKAGDTFKLFKNSLGEIEYGMLIRMSSSGSGVANSLEEYTIDSVIGSTVFVTSDGVRSQLEVSDSVTAYNETSQTTFGSLKSLLSENDKIYVKYDDTGNIDYIWYNGSSDQTVATVGLDEYFVYSVLDSGIVTYRNGSLGTIDMTGTTTAYINSQQTTYSSAKDQIEMGDILYVKNDTDGSVEYIVIEEGNVVGPITVRSDSWYSSIPNFENYSITKDGNRITTDDINTYDIVYYSTDLQLAMVYSNKVTGIYESASPNMATPTTVTISGVEYEVESTEAFNALSSNGSFAYGDTITVLLGKDRQIAGVITPDDSTTNAVTGYVTETGKKEFTNPNSGDTYTSWYVKLVSADGTENEFTTTSDPSNYQNAVCTATLENGNASLRRHSTTNTADLYGEVDADARTIDDRAIASDVAILDVVATDSGQPATYTTVLLRRLDGVNLSSGKVIYYNTNVKGEISEIILNDVTGDAYDYGIITSVSSDDTTGSTLTVDISGSSATISNYAYSRGDCIKGIYSSGQLYKPSRLYVTNRTVSDITNTTITAGGQEYVLSDKVLVYIRTRSGSYTMSNINDLRNNMSDYSSIYAYYDKEYTSGGRVRVIVATAN